MTMAMTFTVPKGSERMVIVMRLIDADELLKEADTCIETTDDFIELINRFPTIPYDMKWNPECEDCRPEGINDCIACRKRLKFTIEEVASGESMRVMQISGFADGELEILKSMNDQNYQEAGKTLLDMLDERNDEIGTILWRSDGVFAWWFTSDNAYVVTGR